MSRNINASVEMAGLAAAMASSSRVAILDALMGGEALPAGELAFRAEVTAATTSEHLTRLVTAGLVRAEQRGRQRYYSLADKRVAHMLEILSLLTPIPRRPSSCPPGLRQARFCYDHLAGQLGVAIADAMIASGGLKLEGEDFVLSKRGEAQIASLGVDIERARSRRRHFSRACLDWSERRPHLAGSLGAALAARLLEIGWIRRNRNDRSTIVTKNGAEGLYRAFGIELG